MAVDAGTVVNPDRVKAQMEGACIYAMSAAFFGEITAKEGRSSSTISTTTGGADGERAEG